MTIEEFLQEIIRAFTKAGVASPEAEARILACHVLSCDNTYLLLHKKEEIDDKVLLASAALINERCKGRPIQYVVGTVDFCGVELAVDERVLIPRPATDFLVELALKEFHEPQSDAACAAGIAEAKKALGLQPSPRVLDLCTGSGCIAAAVAAKLPKAEVIAAELSPKAFMLARVNLRPYGNVKVVRGDLFEALDTDAAFDAILSNPPYVPSSTIPQLSREVRDHEPAMALDGGEDGLDYYRAIPKNFKPALAPGGTLAFEVGIGQCYRVMDMLDEAGYRDIRTRNDLRGIERVVMGSV